MAAEIEQMTQYDWFSQARIHETHSDNDKAFKAYEEALKPMGELGFFGTVKGVCPTNSGT